MTETLYHSFERKNPQAAEATYRHVWDQLKSNNLSAFTVTDRKDRFNLPPTEVPQRKLYIPAKTIMDISGMPDKDALKTTGLSPRPSNASELMGNRQVLSSFRDVSRDYQRYLDVTAPLVDREVRNSRIMATVSLFSYFIDKFAQNFPSTPEFAQGRIVDFMAVPILVSIGRAIRSADMKHKLTNRVDSLSRTPAESTVRLLSDVDKQAAVSLFVCYAVEVTQGLTHLGGTTFDWGDFVAYTLGGAGYWGLLKLRDRNIKKYIEDKVEKKILI